MKRALAGYLLSGEFQNSVWAKPFRKLVRSSRRRYDFSPEFLLDTQSIDRPHYAYCMLNAARLAQRLGHKRISAIEFGVAGGNGLAFMCRFAKDVERVTGVTVDCYGFDTGRGMPPPEGPTDLPYWFQEAQYRMDEPALRARLPEAHLIIGDIRDTIASFIDQHDPAPIGAIMNDTDYHSSTRESFRLFDYAKDHPQNFLPRMFLYFDDIIGTAWEMYGSHNGQLAAIEDLNRAQENIRVHLNQNLISQTHIGYRYQIYYAHLFEHPLYGRYIGNEQQDGLEAALKLK